MPQQAARPFFRIVNGDIIRDPSDPRLQAAQARPAPPAATAGGAAGVPAAGGTPGAAGGGFLDGIAAQIGVADKFLDVPAIPVLGTAAFRVPLIYVLLAAAALALLTFSDGKQGALRMLLAVVGAVALYTHMQRRATLPTTGQLPPAATQRRR